MYKPDTTRTASPGRTATLECCTEPGCESGLRNNYFEGKRLTPEMFRIEQRYLLERRRLLNRAIHGWGVVYGYALAAGAPTVNRQRALSRKFAIETGLALDRCGRELFQAGRIELDLGQVVVLDEKGVCAESARHFASTQEYGHQHGDYSKRTCWLLSVNYAEQYIGGVPVTDPCHCEHHEWDHTCETVRYTLKRIACRDCCAADDCELECDCATGRCCNHDVETDYDGDDADQQSAVSHHRHKRSRRGGCRCLCDHLTGLRPGEDCNGRLCDIEEPCGRVRVDVEHGVPLACVEIVPDDCGGWTFGEDVEDCGPRRLVKRNDLLFDLIRGCDLTRITKIGWHDWHRHEKAVKFDDFREAMGPEGRDKPEYVTKGFWVKFSRPVRKDTLLPDCFVMTVMSVDTEGGWCQPMRVPVVRLDTTMVQAEPDDPPDHVRSARLVVGGSWLEDGCRGRHSVFFAGETAVEIQVRGDFIIDCNGQAVDANAVGLSPAMTGNGAPGGTFLSSFRVEKREGGKGASS